MLYKLNTPSLVHAALSPLAVPRSGSAGASEAELPFCGCTCSDAPRKRAKHSLPSCERPPWLATLPQQLQLLRLGHMEGIRFRLLLNKRCSVGTVCLGSVILLLPNTCIYSETRAKDCDSYLCCQIPTTTRELVQTDRTLRQPRASAFFTRGTARQLSVRATLQQQIQHRKHWGEFRRCSVLLSLSYLFMSVLTCLLLSD